MTKAIWGCGAVAAFVLALATAGVDAQKITREPIQPTKDISGAVTFRAYCAQCHGVSGKGDGPAAAALKVPPADLTGIAKRHGGRFPAAEVKGTITGEHVLAAHGTREMPMWGQAFRSIESASEMELRLYNLVQYLEQMQNK